MIKEVLAFIFYSKILVRNRLFKVQHFKPGQRFNLKVSCKEPEG